MSVFGGTTIVSAAPLTFEVESLETLEAAAVVDAADDVVSWTVEETATDVRPSDITPVVVNTFVFVSVEVADTEIEEAVPLLLVLKVVDVVVSIGMELNPG